MRTQTDTYNVYSFNELSEQAKEKARDWFREGMFDHDWWDCVYEDAATIAAMLGINLKQKPVPLMNGKTRYDPAIYFTLSYSQGDGACYEGNYAYKRGSVKAIKAYAPTDLELHNIAQSLFDAQKAHGFRLTASITSHSDSYVRVEVSTEAGYDFSNANVIREPLQDFASWIYKRLREEYEYQSADEQVDDTIRANEYEFLKNGELA